MPSPAPVLASTRVGRRLAVVRLTSALAWTVPVVTLTYASGPGLRLAMVGGWAQRMDLPAPDRYAAPWLVQGAIRAMLVVLIIDISGGGESVARGGSR